MDSSLVARMIRELDARIDDSEPLKWQLYRSYCAPEKGYGVMIGFKPFFEPTLDGLAVRVLKHLGVELEPPAGLTPMGILNWASRDACIVLGEKHGV